MNKTICLYISLFILFLSSLKCLTDSETKIEAAKTQKTITQDTEISGMKKTESSETKNKGIHESFRKIGWIKEDRYRTLVFIITPDECRTSSKSDIETKLKLAAFHSLQKELNSSLNRNASVQIKKMIDSFGEMIQVDVNCNSENIFFYDIVKKDLKSEFEKIKNIK